MPQSDASREEMPLYMRHLHDQGESAGGHVKAFGTTLRQQDFLFEKPLQSAVGDGVVITRRRSEVHLHRDTACVFIQVHMMIRHGVLCVQDALVAQQFHDAVPAAFHPYIDVSGWPFVGVRLQSCVGLSFQYCRLPSSFAKPSR